MNQNLERAKRDTYLELIFEKKKKKTKKNQKKAHEKRTSNLEHSYLLGANMETVFIN